MKKLLLSIPILLLALNVNAQSAKFAWNTTFGSTGNEQANAITTDELGNVYTVGKFSGTIDFDPGPGVFYLTSYGDEDAFISKQDASGLFLWAKKFGGVQMDEAVSIFLDPMEYIYISGNFSFVADFNPGMGDGIISSFGPTDGFIAKLDRNGMFLWVKGVTNSLLFAAPDELKASIWDNAGFVYATGTMWSASGLADVFVQKIAAGGIGGWTRTMGSNGLDSGNGISIDKFGNVYTIGTFDGAGDFNPTGGVSKLTTNGMKDIFITKFTSAGGFVWAKQIGGANDDICKNIHVSDSGYIYITGSFSGKVDFNPSILEADTSYLESLGMNDMFLAKLDLSGNLKWAKHAGAGEAECYGINLNSDINGNIVVSGVFTDTIDFDPNPAKIFELKSAGNRDIFISKYDTSGNFIWAKQIGGPLDDSCIAMTVQMPGNILTTGIFRDTADFNPAKEEHKMSSAGSYDVFVNKLAYCIPDFTTIKDTICKSITIDGVTYDKSGIYYQTITGVSGCEEFVTLDIDVRTFNDTISKSGVVLTSHANGLKYQWIECTSKKEIPGATGKSYIALGNNKYAVTLFDGSCRDTSDCIEINSFTASMEEFALQNSVKIFPNPSNGEFVIAVDENMLGAKAGIYNLLGQKVREVELNEINTKQSLTSGFYILEISKDQKRFTKKLLVE